MKEGTERRQGGEGKNKIKGKGRRKKNGYEYKEDEGKY